MTILQTESTTEIPLAYLFCHWAVYVVRAVQNTQANNLLNLYIIYHLNVITACCLTYFVY